MRGKTAVLTFLFAASPLFKLLRGGSRSHILSPMCPTQFPMLSLGTLRVARLGTPVGFNFTSIMSQLLPPRYLGAVVESRFVTGTDRYRSLSSLRIDSPLLFCSAVTSFIGACSNETATFNLLPYGFSTLLTLFLRLFHCAAVHIIERGLCVKQRRQCQETMPSPQSCFE